MTTTVNPSILLRADIALWLGLPIAGGTPIGPIDPASDLARAMRRAEAIAAAVGKSAPPVLKIAASRDDDAGRADVP